MLPGFVALAPAPPIAVPRPLPRGDACAGLAFADRRPRGVAAAADTALHEAKRTGRDRTVVAGGAVGYDALTARP